MQYALLDTVVLARDVPDRDLHAGDLGTVVELRDTGELEAEFATWSGARRVLLTLRPQDGRGLTDTDMMAVRPMGGEIPT